MALCPALVKEGGTKAGEYTYDMLPAGQHKLLLYLQFGMAVERDSIQCQEVSLVHRIFHNNHMGSGNIKSTSITHNNKEDVSISSKTA